MKRFSLIYIFTFVFVLSFLKVDMTEGRGRSGPVWSEKKPDAPYLVSLPSLQPIIEELDSTIVNIASSGPARQAPQSGPGGPLGPMDPFSNPEEFFERFFGPGGPQQPQRPRRSMGSGFIISEDGFIVTNNHVIEGAEKVEVTLNLGSSATSAGTREVLEAEIVGRDPRTDLALLKIKKSKLPFASLGNSDQIKKGDWVVAMGNPFGLDHSVSIGIVSAKGREITPNENRRFDDFIQTDAAINFGNSGGPLVNLKGEVIGINTAITAQGSGIGFAIPINQAKDVIAQLHASGTVARGYLGVMIQDITPEIQSALGLASKEGVLVNQIAEDGPAAKSALRAGDVITKVDNEKTPDSRNLQRIIAGKRPNANVNLDVLRDGKPMKLSVRLGSLDDTPAPAATPAAEKTDRLGLVVAPSAEGGVEIREIDPSSPAATSGVMPGDRIVQITYQTKRTNIGNLKDYQNATRNLKSGESVLLNLVRASGPAQTVNLFVAFRLP